MMEKTFSSPGRTGVIVLLFVVFLMAAAFAGGLWFSDLKEPRIVERIEKAIPKAAKIAPPLKLPTALSERETILEDRLTQVSEAAMPAVVNVFSERVRRQPMFPGFYFGPGMGRKERSLGSGVIVRPDGYVITNNHVIEEAVDIKVALSDKREFKAVVVGADPRTDLAILKIDAADLPALDLADSDKVKVGQVVLAIGNPFGLAGTVTMGIVSARGRSGIIQGEGGLYEDFIQTDAAINPGNSGGALIDLSGELVGINTAIFSRSGGYMGIGFAIPANLARTVMEGLINDGEVRRGFLGVVLQELTPELAAQFGLEAGQGALVAQVADDTPAKKAGLESGDIITAVNGKPVEDEARLRLTIASYPPGTEIELTVIREGKEAKVKAVLSDQPGARPARAPRSEPKASKIDFAGMTAATLTPALADQLGISPDDGAVVVIDVKQGGRADHAGIQIGDVILKVNRMEIGSFSDLMAAAENNRGKPLLLLVKRQGAGKFVIVPEK